MDAREAVEQMLLDRGFYSPLELLLATNRLGHEDYWAWRRGALISLDEALAGSTAEIKALLEEAEAWAQGLALDAEAMVHRGWEQNAGAELRASRHSSLNALLGRRFRRIREQGQLDIFLDGADTIAANALRDALCAREPRRAKEELERLISLHPGHEAEEQAATLIAALEMPNPEGAAQGFEQLDRLERKWLPAASHLLGDRSRDFLAPLWIGIGKALAAVSFDPLRPTRHASWAYQQCPDWGNLKLLVLAEQGYAAQPVLLERLAEAEWWLRNRPQAIAHWFALCWQAPGEFKRLVQTPSFPDSAVRKAWHLMRGRDSKLEMSPAWFPAWMLLEEPGLAHALAPDGDEGGPQRAFKLVIALLAEVGANKPSIALREELQALHPELLARYLEKFA